MTEAKRGGSVLTEDALTRAVRAELDNVRQAFLPGKRLERDDIARRVVEAVGALQRPRLMPVLNATGVVIHTNLGRAPVSPETAEAMREAAAHPVPLEIEPESNQRGGRMREISELLRALTGAESALVVNNCASAVLLVLAAVAPKEVVVSRGEAVEIGGGFRVPDVLRQSGARLVEVGTTNRTYARDYAVATTEQTAAYLKVIRVISGRLGLSIRFHCRVGCSRAGIWTPGCRRSGERRAFGYVSLRADAGTNSRRRH